MSDTVSYLSRIRLLNGETYEIKDSEAREQIRLLFSGDLIFDGGTSVVEEDVIIFDGGTSGVNEDATTT